MLSVAAETAVYSQQVFQRARDATDPSTGFSSLVDSNTNAASANRDESARQPSDQAAPPRGDDSNSADAANTNGKTPPARGERKTGSNSDSSTKTTDATGQQQPADTAATADPDKPTAAVKVISADAAPQGIPSQSDGKGKATTKGDAKGDGSTADAPQSAPVDQATTLVVAVVAEVTSPTSASPNGDSSPSAGTATTAASSLPGAIAAAAASKVAADVAATESAVAAQPDVIVAQGQPTDAKAAVTDQAQLIVAAQQSAPQTANPVPAPPVSTAALADDAALLAQAAAAAQATGPVKAGVPSTPTVKATKSTSITADAKAAVGNIEQPAAVDPQTKKITATDDTKAADPIAPKKSAGAPQTHDTPDETAIKAQPDADAAVAPTLHQHTTAEPKVAQPSAFSTPDVANANAAQSAAVNAAAATTPAPAAATALNTANLTVVTGQAVPLSGLAVEISVNAKAGNSRFEIRLDPPDLGRIDVRLDVDKNGQVTSRLFVEKSETLDLLRRDAPQLQQALQDAGLKTSDSGLQFSLRDQNPQQDQSNSNGNRQNPQRLVIAEDDSAAAASAAGRSYARSLSTAGGVDIRV